MVGWRERGRKSWATLRSNIREKRRWKIGAGLACALVVLAIAIGIRAYDALNIRRSNGVDDRIALADARITDRAAIRRGEYVMRTGDCLACHSSDKGEFAGGHDFVTEFGTLQSSNITPDRETGIGRMTERDFFNAVRHGRGSKGLLYPAMPYTAYTKLSDQDVHDLWAYMATVKPVKNAVEENSGLAFPYNLRAAMIGWNLLFFDNEGFSEPVGLSLQQARGKYIVDGGGHCSACHSPRNALGAERAGAYLQGARLGVWHVPDITSNPHTGVGGISNAAIAAYLKTGANDVSVAAGPMAEAVEHSLQYLTQQDVEAVAAYLQTVPASNGVRRRSMVLTDATRSRGALSYEVNCSACHGLGGEGIRGMVPAFRGNRAIMADDPASLITATLGGGRAAHTQARQTAAGMPAFDWKMNDAQIAEILNHVRNSWGNGAQPVTSEQVRELRKQLGAREKLAVPGRGPVPEDHRSPPRERTDVADH